MNNSIFGQNRDLLSSLLNQNQEIGIILGVPHKLDAIAAGLSLYLSLLSLGKHVQIISSEDPIVEHSHLFAIDKIRKTFEGKTQVFTISAPNANGEIEKISYSEEGNRVHLNLFGGPQGINFSEKDLQFIKKGSSPSVIIAVGVERFSDIAPFASDPAIRIVNIDASALNEFYGDIVYVDPQFSSISEVVTNIILENNLPIEPDTAQNLLDGIIDGTKNFTSPTSSMYAFEAAGFLLRVGAKRKVENSADKQSIRFQQPTQQFNMRKPLSQPTKPPVAVDPLSYLNPQPVAPKRTAVDHADAIFEKPQETNNDASEIPEDWLAPKVFRESKNQ